MGTLSAIIRICLLKFACAERVAEDTVDAGWPSFASKGFLEFSVLGDLTNLRECIVNAVLISNMLNLTLVLPETGNLSDVWDAQYMRTQLAAHGVEVVNSSEVPQHVAQAVLEPPSSFLEVKTDPKDKSALTSLVKAWEPIVEMNRGARFVTFGTSDYNNIGFRVYESRKIRQCETDFDLCGSIHSSIRHTDLIREHAKKILHKLNQNGTLWLAMHWHVVDAFL